MRDTDAATSEREGGSDHPMVVEPEREVHLGFRLLGARVGSVALLPEDSLVRSSSRIVL